MGYRIAEEAESWAPHSLTWRERYVLSVLAHVAYENRRCKAGTTSDPEILRRVRLSQKELYAVMRSLIDKKALLRIQRGQNGRQAEYAIPEFAQGPSFPD